MNIDVHGGHWQPSGLISGGRCEYRCSRWSLAAIWIN